MSRELMEHQKKEFERSKNERSWALYWQMRVGKTAVIIHTCEHQHKQGLIDAAVVVAFPSAVHRVWITEWEKDWPEDLSYRALAWQSSKAKLASAKAEREVLLSYKGFSVLTLNCEALLTQTCWAYLERFINKRRVLLCADESSFMSDPSAARTKRMLALSKRPNVISKRIADGTPVDESPLNVFAPCLFLDPAILGHKSIFTFRARFAEVVTGYGAGGHTFKTIATDDSGRKQYRNLDELRTKILSKGSRLLRSDISDAPPKTYTNIAFELTPKQRAIYDRLVNEYELEINEATLTKPHVLSRLTMLQMVARNFVPPYKQGMPHVECSAQGCERCDHLGYLIEHHDLQRIDPDNNPAQEAFADFLRQADEPIICWTKFRQDASDCTETAIRLGRSVVKYDGSIPADTRELGYEAFRSGQVDTIVATIESGLSRGHDLTRAGSLFYYSNSYSRRARGQSEDRAEGVLRTRSTGIFDLIAADTRDEDVLRILKHKQETASFVMGDNR